jgi:hypothetical protein
MHDSFELICYLMFVQVCNKITVEWYVPTKHVILDSGVFSRVVLAPRKSSNTTQQSKSSSSSLPSKPARSSKVATKDTEMNYDPTKLKYHPIDDACWSREDKYVVLCWWAEFDILTACD